jgi:hypothetical protein
MVTRAWERGGLGAWGLGSVGALEAWGLWRLGGFGGLGALEAWDALKGCEGSTLRLQPPFCIFHFALFIETVLRLGKLWRLGTFNAPTFNA